MKNANFIGVTTAALLFIVSSSVSGAIPDINWVINREGQCQSKIEWHDNIGLIDDDSDSSAYLHYDQTTATPAALSDTTSFADNYEDSSVTSSLASLAAKNNQTQGFRIQSIAVYSSSIRAVPNSGEWYNLYASGTFKDTATGTPGTGSFNQVYYAGDININATTGAVPYPEFYTGMIIEAKAGRTWIRAVWDDAYDEWNITGKTFFWNTTTMSYDTQDIEETVGFLESLNKTYQFRERLTVTQSMLIQTKLNRDGYPTAWKNAGLQIEDGTGIHTQHLRMEATVDVDAVSDNEP
jgi:hypothetical protein